MVSATAARTPCSSAASSRDANHFAIRVIVRVSRSIGRVWKSFQVVSNVDVAGEGAWYPVGPR
jgi:hypothetical protein